jgi:type IV secretory pathway VirB4 component
LSLPPKQKIRGIFNLGSVLYEDEKWPAGISSSELMQNMAIFGRKGAGKTNVAFYLMEQLVEKKIPFLFLDWKRTARHLIPKFKDKINVYTPGRSLSKFVFNPFIPPPTVQGR